MPASFAELADESVEGGRKQEAEGGDPDHPEQHSSAQGLTHFRPRPGRQHQVIVTVGRLERSAGADVRDDGAVADRARPTAEAQEMWSPGDECWTGVTVSPARAPTAAS